MMRSSSGATDAHDRAGTAPAGSGRLRRDRGRLGPETAARTARGHPCPFEAEGDRAGHEFKTEANARRLANLVNKGDVFRRAIVRPESSPASGTSWRRRQVSSLNARSGRYPLRGRPALHVDMGRGAGRKGLLVCNRSGSSTTSPRERRHPHGAGLSHLGHAATGRPEGRHGGHIRRRSC